MPRVVRDRNGQALNYVYFKDEHGRGPQLAIKIVMIR